MVGMVERVDPGPGAKVDAVVRLSKSLETDKETVRMRLLPRLSSQGALLLGYSKRQLLWLYGG